MPVFTGSLMRPWAGTPGFRACGGRRSSFTEFTRSHLLGGRVAPGCAREESLLGQTAALRACVLALLSPSGANALPRAGCVFGERGARGCPTMPRGVVSVCTLRVPRGAGRPSLLPPRGCALPETRP